MLAAINIHPHSLKKGSHVEAANDSSGDTAAQVPAGAAQNVFGSLLQSFAQVIGVQLSAAPSAHAASSPPAAGTTAAAAFTAGAASPANQSANTLLQNVLNGDPVKPKLRRSTVSVNA